MKQDSEQPIIRRATLADVPALAALTDAAYSKYVARIGWKPQPMTTDYQQFVSQYPVWVLEVEQRLAGVLALEREADALLIYSVAINPADQKRGFGRLLLAWTEDEARQAGYTSIRLYTHERMEENIALYSKLGYNETKREPYRDSSRVHMRKQLLPSSPCQPSKE